MEGEGMIEWRKLETKEVLLEVTLYTCNPVALDPIPANAPVTMTGVSRGFP
jgi:hypothetical protein